LAVVEAFGVAAAVERDRAEKVPPNRPRRGGTEPPLERPLAEREQREQEHGVVVREAVAELPPPAVLVQQILERDHARRDRERAVQEPRLLRPEQPEVERRREPQREAVLVDDERRRSGHVHVL